jgi:hypothetical protein
MLSVARGLYYAITRGAGVAITGPDSDLFADLTDGTILGVPLPLIYLLATATAIFLHHTASGRSVNQAVEIVDGHEISGRLRLAWHQGLAGIRLDGEVVGCGPVDALVHLSHNRLKRERLGRSPAPRIFST